MIAKTACSRVSYGTRPSNAVARLPSETRVAGITPTMLTKCLVELEEAGLVHREQFNEIPPRVEYSLTEREKTLLPALDELYQWADAQMHGATPEG